MNKPLAILCLLLLWILGTESGQAQSEDPYYPKGNPKEWNLELTPFLWLPSMSGELNLGRISGDIEIPAVDLISKLQMGFMMTAEVSKGKFFMAPTYVYTDLGAEKVLWSSDNGEYEVGMHPNLKMNIFELIAGARFRVNDSFIVDPFAGFRYSNYKIYGSLEGINTHSFEDTSEFWDPLLGVQLSYYPHPRVPILIKTDIGGFGAGTELSWTFRVNSGYSVSPAFDLTAGFSAYGADYQKNTELRNAVGLNMIMYGLDIGAIYHVPKRKKNDAVFKK